MKILFITMFKVLFLIFNMKTVVLEFPRKAACAIFVGVHKVIIPFEKTGAVAHGVTVFRHHDGRTVLIKGGKRFHIHIARVAGILSEASGRIAGLRFSHRLSVKPLRTFIVIFAFARFVVMQVSFLS